MAPRKKKAVITQTAADFISGIDPVLILKGQDVNISLVGVEIDENAGCDVRLFSMPRPTLDELRQKRVRQQKFSLPLDELPMFAEDD